MELESEISEGASPSESAAEPFEVAGDTIGRSILCRCEGTLMGAAHREKLGIGRAKDRGSALSSKS